MSLVLLENGPIEGVRVLTLNDPDKRNALSPGLQAELRAAIAAVRDDADARALVVAGNGKAFSAGADLPAVFGAERSVGELREHLVAIYSSFLSVADLQIPTIAVVQGAAVGAGVNLSMSCDVRVAGPQASFGVSFTKMGLHPGGGCTYFAVQALGRQRALNLLLTGGSIAAEEALATGLVLEIASDPLARAIELAGMYAALDPSLVRDIKRTVAIAEAGDFDATLEFEAWAQASSATGNEKFQAAVESFRR